MLQLLKQKRCPEAKSRPPALARLLVMMAVIAVPIGFVGAQGSKLVFSDDFESGVFTDDWTGVENFEVIEDPTGERPSFVASVIDLAQDTPPTVMSKDDLLLGPGTTARVFFYDDGVQDGDDHTAVLDGDLGSIGILARFSVDSLPSSTNYIFETGTTDIPRTVGWHEFRFEITSTGASAFIDGELVGTVPEITAAEIFGIESNGGDIALWDDVAVSHGFAQPPTIVVTCGFRGGEGPDLSQAPVVLPEERDRLQSFRTECREAGGHLVRERL